jgi:transcription elongation factor SPT5
MTDEITQQTLLPGVKDPNLWVVKCVPGTERETVLKLMQKFIALENSRDPDHTSLQIR